MTTKSVYEQLLEQEAIFKAQAYQLFKTKNPQISPMQMPVQFNQALANGTVSYSKPAENYLKTHPGADKQDTSTEAESEAPETASDALESDGNDGTDGEQPEQLGGPTDDEVSNEEEERINNGDNEETEEEGYEVDGKLTWQVLYQHNKDVIGGNPNLIKPGQRLKMPDGSIYTVQKGDYLIKIASNFKPADKPKKEVDEPAPPPEAAPIEVAPERKILIKTTPNPLHDYASYTYGLTLHMLNKQDFNALAMNPASGTWKPSMTLVASAGKYGPTGSGFTRVAAFNDDFYFDNFKMKTIVGSTSGNRGTDSIDVSFTLIEPYGMTLIDRLIDACNDPRVKGNNYLEVPYLLQIDFYGYDDEGVGIALLDQRKYIPISINGMKIKTGVKGTEYSMEATPYSHGAFMESVAGTPANFEITAKTLEDFFQDDVNVDEAVKKFNERQESEAKAKADAEARDSKTASQDTRSQAKQDSTGDNTKEEPTYEVRSYVAAYNAWQARTKKNKTATDFNTIRVVFDPAILANGGGKMINEKSQSSKQVAEKDPKKNRASLVRADAGKNTAKPDFSVGKFSISGGTSIMEVINTAMLSTEYVRSQIVDPTLGAEANVEKLKKDVKWWKISPQLQMRSFDTQNSKWFYDITYYVEQKIVYNRTHPLIPKSVPVGWHKEYNYIYTGQNDDIIDFSIDFDATFYTAVTVDRNKNQDVAGPQGNAEAGDEQDSKVINGNPKNAKKSPITPTKTVPVGDQANATASGNLKKDSVGVASGSVAEHLNNGGAADQLQVKIKIVGDPQFIKQDELYVYQKSMREIVEEATGYVGDGSDTNSIDMNASEIHALLTWKTPMDIDEVTGGLRKDPRYLISGFSGIYNILEVETTLAQGKFEQTVDMVRLPDQPLDYEEVSFTAADIRDNNVTEPVGPDPVDGYESVDEEPEENPEDSPTEDDVWQYMDEHPDEPSDEDQEPGDESEEDGEPDQEELSNIANSDEETSIDEAEDESNSEAESDGTIQDYPEP